MNRNKMSELSEDQLFEVNGGGVATLAGREVGKMIAAVEDFVEEGITGIYKIATSGSPH